MCFRLVPKSVTLNDLERRDGVILHYFSEFGQLPGALRKSSRSLSHLMMSSCYKFKNPKMLVRCSQGVLQSGKQRICKVGRIASDEVVLHLVKYQCMPILLYGFDTLNLNKSLLNSLDYVANRFLMKRFNTNRLNVQTIEFCRAQFHFVLPSRQIANRRPTQ